MNTQKATILIVDDNPTNLDLLFESLSQAGFKVLVAKDGHSAIRQAELARPDAILLDIIMPGLDGFETCRCLKDGAETKDIPVIFLTALTDTIDKVEGFKVGAVDYITKPFQQAEVLARLEAHLTIRHLQKSLQEKNERLEQEINERKQAEESLRKLSRVQSISRGGNKRRNCIQLFSGQFFTQQIITLEVRSTFKLRENRKVWRTVSNR